MIATTPNDLSQNQAQAIHRRPSTVQTNSRNDKNERNSYALKLLLQKKSQALLPTPAVNFSFSQHLDGVYRCTLPPDTDTLRIPLEYNKLQSKPAPTTLPPALPIIISQRKSSNLEDKVNKSIALARYNGTSAILTKLKTFNDAKQDQQLESIAHCGHFFIAENVEKITLGSKEQTLLLRKQWHARHKLSQEVAIQKRNVYQYNLINRQLDQTRTIINMKKLRNAAFTTFLNQQALEKSNATTKWFLIAVVLAKATKTFTLKLLAHRMQKREDKLNLATITIVGFFSKILLINRKKNSVAVIETFLRLVKRDGQIKRVVKRLQWVLIKLQKLMRDILACNAATVIMIHLKYNRVVEQHLINIEEMRKKKKTSPNSSKYRKQAPPPPPPPEEDAIIMPDEYIDTAILNFVIRERQNFVTRLIKYEEYELYPVMLDMVREKSMNPLEARIYVKEVRRKCQTRAWIVENGGAEYIEDQPRYQRVPTEAEIIKDIYEPCLAKFKKEFQEIAELDLMMSQLHDSLDKKADENEKEGESATPRDGKKSSTGKSSKK